MINVLRPRLILVQKLCVMWQKMDGPGMFGIIIVLKAAWGYKYNEII